MSAGNFSTRTADHGLVPRFYASPYTTNELKSRRSVAGKRRNNSNNRSVVDKVYRQNLQQANFTGSVGFSFSSGNFDIPANQAAKPTYFVATLGVDVASEPIVVRWRFEHEGAASSRPIMVVPGQKTRIVIRVPSSTDYSTQPTSTQWISLSATTITPGMKGNVWEMVEAWANLMPIFG